jgi:Dolichyl-phosphate-mannose-protein mannosyltransferase
MKADARVVRALVFAAAAAAFAAFVIAFTGGISIPAGPFLIRAHNAARAVIIAALLAAAALLAGRREARSALEWWWTALGRQARIAVAVIAVATVATGVAWGTFVAGGSDSYSYLNQAELFARGMVRDFEPLATDATWPGTVWAFAPAGHTPSNGPRGYFVPICPPGYPLMLAAARLTFGRTAMFWVTPLLGGLTVYLAFVIARGLAGSAAGLLAAVLTACSPTFLMQLVQPMSDVPAAALWCAVLVAVGSRRRTSDIGRALVAGLLCGIALTIRPNLVPLAAVAALAIALEPPGKTIAQRLMTIVVFGVAAAPGVIVILALQNAMYGSPLSSGYGDLSLLFAGSNVMPNLRRYPDWLVRAHTPLILAAFASPFVLTGSARRYSISLLAFAAVTLACYLPYVVFDAWWYTRFLLPAIPSLLALAAVVTVRAIEKAPASVRAVAVSAACGIFAIVYISIAEHRGAFDAKAFEARFRSGGEYVRSLPQNAAVVTGHQSGSIRFYAGRTTAGWGDIDPGRLDEALEFLRRHGRRPYLLFENWEEPLFKQRFARDRLGRLDWPPIAVIDGIVRIYDPADYDGSRSHAANSTEGMSRQDRPAFR